MQHLATGISLKAVIATSGLAGGITVAGFYIPKRIAEKGIYFGGVIIGGSSIFTSMAFTEIIITKLGFDPTIYAMPVSFIIGGISLFVLNAIGNWARKHENDDIIEVVKEIDKYKEKE
jgi:hypothetical protein